MDLLAITAQLYVLNGTVQEIGTVPGLIAQPAPVKTARGRERDFLFAHLTLNGPLEETASLADQLVEALAGDFYQSSGSVTASLRRAVIATNERLLQHNLAASPSQGSTVVYEGALTCAALHNDELYTLQVGEGLAFLGHNFGVERLPVRQPQHMTPLGRSAGIDIRFAYHRLQSGDMMLLTDPRLAYLTGNTLAPVLVDTEIETGLESLIGLVAGDTARLLLVEFSDELPSTLPLTFQHSKKSPPPKRKAAAPVVAATSSQSLPSKTQPVRTTDQPVGINTGRQDPEPYVESQVEEQAPAVAVGLAVETSARRVASTSARGLSRASGWLALALGRLTVSERTSEEAETSINWMIPAAIALLVPIILAVVVTGVFFQRGNVEQLGAIKQQMVDALTLAETSSGDPAAARNQYNAVIALAGDAEAIRPGDPEVFRLRNEARAALDRLDGVTSLSAIPFYRYDKDTNLSRIIQTGESSGIVVLDQSGGQVQLHQIMPNSLNALSGEPTTLAFTGQAVGNQVIGTLVDILWLPSGAGSPRDNVAILDRSGQLFNYFPNLGDMRGIVLDNSSAWLNPTVMNTFTNRLYVLDTGTERIWKYYPQDAGFTQQQDDPFISFSSEMDLDQAVDFDIYAEDGSIIVVYRDGRVRYYDSRSGTIQWDETTLANGGLTAPLIAPAAVDITGRGLTASIFILDPGSGRLVQISRGGTVLAQYRILDAAENDVLTLASDFVVEEAPLQVFVVAGNTIYQAARN